MARLSEDFGCRASAGSGVNHMEAVFAFNAPHTARRAVAPNANLDRATHPRPKSRDPGRSRRPTTSTVNPFTHRWHHPQPAEPKAEKVSGTNGVVQANFAFLRP